MRVERHFSIGAAAAALLLALAASAEPLMASSTLRQEPSRLNASGADLEIGYSNADDFTVSSPTGVFYLDEVVVWGTYQLASPGGDVEVRIHEDDGGLPGSTVYVETALVPVSRIETGSVINGFLPEIKLIVLLPTPAVLNDGSYWVEVLADTTGYPAAFHWEWATGPDPERGSTGRAVSNTAPGTTWTFEPVRDLAIELNGSPYLPLYRESFVGAGSMTASVACGSGGGWFVRSDCPSSSYGPTPPYHATWNATAGNCSSYGVGPHRAILSSPTIPIAACPNGEVAVVELDYLLDLQENFNYDRAWIEVEIDGVLEVLATNESGGAVDITCGDPLPTPDGRLKDGSWQHLELAAGQGNLMTLRFVGDVADGMSNSGQGFLIDDVRVRCGLPPLLSDGFESGSTAAWSTSVGAL